jgi:hypothetical protein
LKEEGVTAATVVYGDGVFLVSAGASRRRFAAQKIRSIVEVRVAGFLDDDEDPFHIVQTDDEIVVIGPFVRGGLGALENLAADWPQISRRSCLTANVPYRFRARGFLGLRLFPVAGLAVAPLSALAAFDFIG